MPTYEYRCLRCGAEFEQFQKMTDEPLEECAECGGEVQRLISRGGGIVFKGAGFYATDYHGPGEAHTSWAGAPEGFEVQVERPADLSHGDLSSNAALVLSGRLGRPPRQIAEELVENFDAENAGVVSVEIAGPGFLNFRLDDSQLWALSSGRWSRGTAGEEPSVNRRARSTWSS